jgi:hypothetical protein
LIRTTFALRSLPTEEPLADSWTLSVNIHRYSRTNIAIHCLQ